MRGIVACRSSRVSSSCLVALSLVVFAADADGQSQPTGQRCGSLFSLSRTHNLSTAVTHRTLACSGVPIAFAHWYDLADDPDLRASNLILTCVEFTMWSSTSVNDQEVFVRVFEDLTTGRSGECGPLDDPGPDVAGSVLLWEGSVSYCPSTSGVADTVTPRRDGHRTVPVGPDWNNDGTQDGLWLPEGTIFFVEIGVLGENTVRFGANVAGEEGDWEGASSANVTWVKKQSSCNGGGCVSADYMKNSEWLPTIDRDVVLVLHFEMTDNTVPAPLPVCPEDISGPAAARDGRVDVTDLLALLATWSQPAPPRPTGDVAPRYFGDNKVNVGDLLALLAAWGDCPNPRADCFDVAHRLPPLEYVGEGSHSFLIDGPLDGPPRFATNEITVFQCDPTSCGWHDYGEGGIDGAFRYGDAFGINAATGEVGGDTWFVYVPSFIGMARLSTQSVDGCPPEEATDTMIEVYPFHHLSPCANQWNERIACDDSSATGCGDHAQLTLSVNAGTRYLVRIAGKFGERGIGTLTIEPEP